MKIFLESNGCVRRKVELEQIRHFLKANGHILQDSPHGADLILVGTCACNEVEENVSFQRIESLNRLPAKMLIYGCVPEVSPDRFAPYREKASCLPKNLEGIDAFFPGSKIPFEEAILQPSCVPEIPLSNLPNAWAKFRMLDWNFLGAQFRRCGRYGVKQLSSLLGKGGSEKDPFHILVSRGCVGACSYCSITKAIGKVKSTSPEAVHSQFTKAIGRGRRNIHLISDDLGAYGIDLKTDFSSLLDRLLPSKGTGTDLPEDLAITLNEINPHWVLRSSERYAEIFSHAAIREIICPIQSGSARILRSMNRNAELEKTGAVIKSLKKANPRVKLTTHAIVGFPGETPEDLEKTVEFIAWAQYDLVYLFPFLDNPTAPSHTLPGKIDEIEKRRRMHMVTDGLKNHGIAFTLNCQ